MIFLSSGDLFLIGAGADICNCIYYRSRGGTALRKSGSTCLEDMGKEIDIPALDMCNIFRNVSTLINHSEFRLLLNTIVLIK